MKSLVFKEDFVFFQKEYGFSRDIIDQVYVSPTKIENYSLNKNLYYKNIKNRHLILCMKRRGILDVFSFCFWIPDDIFNVNNTLNSILILFINRFGNIVSVNNKEDKYIGNSGILPLSQTEILEVQNGNLKSFNNIIKIYAENHTPRYFNYDILINDKGVELKNIFAINNFRYLAWFKNVELETISIDIDWLDHLNSVVDNINPVERTKLKIKTVSKKYLSYRVKPEIRNKKIDFSYPKLYSKQFEIITNSIEKGGNVEVLFLVSEDKKKCVFCGKTPVSKEHIFPEWFKNYFPEQTFDNVSGPFTYDDPIRSITKGVTSGLESSYGITSRNVCATCNNVWLSKLEKEVKGIITKDSTLLNENISEFNLTESKSFTLSKWLICKALLLSIRTHGILNFPDSVCSLLKDNIIHKGFIVEVFTTKSHNLNYRNKFDPLFHGGQKALKDYFKNPTFLFVSVIHIGNFLFRISFWEHDEKLIRVSLRLPTITLFPYKYELPFPKEGGLLDIDQFDGNNLIFVFAESLSLIENHPSFFV